MITAASNAMITAFNKTKEISTIKPGKKLGNNLNKQMLVLLIRSSQEQAHRKT